MNRRLIVMALLSLTATGLVIGSAVRKPDDSTAVAAVALKRAALARAAVPATVVTTTTTTVTTQAPTAAAQAPAPAVQDTPAPAVADTQSESTTTTQTTSTTTTPDISTKVGHVFVIALPGSAYDATFAGLRPQGRLLSGYAPLADSDLPDYIAAISGQPPNAATKAGCATPGDFPSSAKPNDQGVVAGDGCVYPVDAITLADQITGKGKVWKAYIEGQTQACTPGPENPFAYFHSLLDLGACSTGEVPLDQLAGDLTSGKKTPAFSFIVPTSPLSQLTPQILGSPAYKKDGLLVISYGAHPGGTLLLSPFVKAGGDDASPYNAYSLLRTVDDIFGVSPLAEAGGDGVKPFKGVVTGSGV